MSLVKLHFFNLKEAILLCNKSSFATCLLVLCLLFTQASQAQGDFNFLREPADTNEIFQNISTNNLNRNTQNSVIINNSSYNATLSNDTLKQSFPNDTTEQSNEPLSGFFGAIEKTDTALQTNSGGSFPAQLDSESQDGFSIAKEKKLYKAQNRSQRSAFEDTVLFYVFCGIIFIYALTRIWFSTYVGNLFRAFQNLRTARLHYEDASFRDNIPKILLLINSVLVFSLFVYWFVSRYFENSSNPLLLWASCFFIFMLFFVIRLFAIKASAWMFPLTDIIDYYFYNIELVNIVTAWILTPLLMFALFLNGVSNNIIAGVLLVTWLFFVLIRIYRGYQIGQNTLINYPFYFFIYLCTLEISPILVIYKFFIKI